MKSKIIVTAIEKAIESAFIDGINWAETYSSWFIPSDAENKAKLDMAIAKAMNIYSDVLKGEL
jgi:hypothetical protein